MSEQNEKLYLTADEAAKMMGVSKSPRLQSHASDEQGTEGNGLLRSFRQGQPQVFHGKS